jgi:hypothetical protein
MAYKPITFQADQLIGYVTALQAVQLPYAGKRALQKLGFELRKDLASYMGEQFANPVQFTLRSPRYSADELELTISISKDGAKGQDPARYLYPVSTEDGAGGKAAYTTRFTRALRKTGVIDAATYAIPFLEGRGVRLNSYGNMSPGQYQQVLTALKSDSGMGAGKRAWRYFAIPDRRRTSTRPNRLPAGIYRAKGNDVQRLFALTTTQPKVPTIFDFYGRISSSSERLMPTLLSQALRDALGG